MDNKHNLAGAMKHKAVDFTEMHRHEHGRVLEERAPLLGGSVALVQDSVSIW